MIATKEQERKALEKIKKIVADLGPDSYLSTAFKGCFEDAEYNIEYDFACSPYDRWISEKRRADSLEERVTELKQEIIQVEKNYETSQEQLKKKEAQLISQDDIVSIVRLIGYRKQELDSEVRNAAERIVVAAGDPESAAFKNAVSDHRAAKKEADFYNALSDRILRIKTE